MATKAGKENNETLKLKIYLTKGVFYKDAKSKSTGTYSYDM